jgi:glycosyltransferase involved in cell wall biosynthesis
MKILYITNGYPPHRWAGTETYTASLATGMYSRGHDVKVMCIGKWREGEEYWNGYEDSIVNGVPVRRINLNWKKSPRPFEYLYNNPVVADFLSENLKEINPNLVHITSCETLSASTLDAVHTAGYPLILSLTDFWFLCPRINLLKHNGNNCDGDTTPWECLKCKLGNSKAYQLPKRFFPESVLLKILLQVSKQPSLTRIRGLRGMAGNMDKRKEYLRDSLRKPDHIVTASPFVKKVFLLNNPDLTIHVQPYGHDLQWVERYQGKTTSNDLRIGFVGQLSSSKGVHILLKALKKLNNSKKGDFQAFIYGNLKHNVEYSTKLRKLTEGLKQVYFCGTYDHDQSADVFANIDVLVVPSLWYDFPLVIYEAFATKTPVVATNLGGMAEAITHDKNGLLFSRGNVRDLAKQLERILTEDDLLLKLRSGIAPVKRIEEELDEFEELYKALTSRTTENTYERASIYG